ncbi:MAG: NADH-quinone oxidoreductase subunit NuoB [Nitrospirota bacterium]|nr:NADH-quinone oxidoreductase subunit NuoB [Nitrospirota bacterium]MDH5700725.1 NADH-quinone oxidoreductase subunit NuoB [Nitrospirota bacterium]
MGILDDAFLKSLWVFHLATGSCNNCDIEILDCLTPRHDIERFGMLLTGSIKHADVLLVTGAVNRQCIPRIKRLYEQMPQPRLVVAIGECALSRGVFIHSYNCPLPLDHVIPVDVYIPGCPPRPEAIIAGLVKLIDQRKAQTGQAKV